MKQFIEQVKQVCQDQNKDYSSLYIRQDDNEFLAGSNFEGSNTFIFYNNKWHERVSWSGKDIELSQDITNQDIINFLMSYAWNNEQ